MESSEQVYIPLRDLNTPKKKKMKSGKIFTFSNRILSPMFGGKDPCTMTKSSVVTFLCKPLMCTTAKSRLISPLIILSDTLAISAKIKKIKDKIIS